jgi:hypothetical protein
MSLSNPGIGEITDRLTILALKILYRGAAGRPTKHFEDERNVLLTKIAARQLNGGWVESLLAIGAVNAALWAAEDALREYRKDHTAGIVSREALWEDAVKVAFRIQELNDQRAALIETINKQAGDFLGSEKA